MRKKRIFIANDAHFLGSGYGVYGKELLTRLHNSGKYEVGELGCFAGPKDVKKHNIPWRFYPNSLDGPDDPRHKQLTSNKLNNYGMWRFTRAILDFKPDIVIDIRDYWMCAYQENHPFRKFYKWVILPTVDSAPQKTEWLYTYANADLIIPYTEWAKNTLLSQCGNQIKLFPKIANAGINPSEFFPIDNKTQHKINILGRDVNVVGVVMRNQTRKLFADVFEVFRAFLDKTKNQTSKDTILYLHTSYPEQHGWDFPNLLLEYGLSNHVYFTYICQNCKKWFPCKFQSAITHCQYCHTNGAIFTSTKNHLNTQSLNEVYNLFDYFLQYSICEGFGMPQLEAAACGVPVASADYSAMSEIVRNLHGTPIPIQKTFRELASNAKRVYPDNDFTVDLLEKFFLHTTDEDKQQMQQKTRSSCIEQYTWDSVYKVWEEALDSVDISTNIPWNTTERFLTHNDKIVPKDLNARDCALFVCNEIINDPYLFNTAGVQQIIRDMHNKIIAQNGMTRQITFVDMMDQFENLLTNKVGTEKMRLNPRSLTQEDFILCQHQK